MEKTKLGICSFSSLFFKIEIRPLPALHVTRGCFIIHAAKSKRQGIINTFTVYNGEKMIC